MKTFDQYLEMVHKNMIPSEEMVRINAILISTEDHQKLFNKLEKIVAQYVKDDKDIEDTVNALIAGKKPWYTDGDK